MVFRAAQHNLVLRSHGAREGGILEAREGVPAECTPEATSHLSDGSKSTKKVVGRKDHARLAAQRTPPTEQ